MYRRSSIRLCQSIFRQSSTPASKSYSSGPNKCTPEATSLLNSKRNHSFSTTQMKKFQNLRLYSVETDRQVDTINLKFAEAREEVESALESKETVYFDEEAEFARSAVEEVLSLYQGLLAKLPEKEKGAIQRAMGMKIEQLKAELAQLDE